MTTIDFFRLRVHVLTADAYISGAMLLPMRGTANRPPRFLDVLNNPTLFMRNPGEVPSDTALVLVDGARHLLQREGSRPFTRLFLKLDAILLGSDESSPGALGTGLRHTTTGAPERFELMLRGGIQVIGAVRGGTKTVLYTHSGQRFIALTEVRYTTPLKVDELHQLDFAAINTRHIESAIRVADDEGS